MLLIQQKNNKYLDMAVTLWQPYFLKYELKKALILAKGR